MAGYEDPGFVGGVAFPVVSTLIAGERGGFKLVSAAADGVLPGCALIAARRDCVLDWRSIYDQVEEGGHRTEPAQIWVHPCAR